METLKRPAVAAALCWIAGSSLAAGGMKPLPWQLCLLFACAGAALCGFRRKGYKLLLLLLLIPTGNWYYLLQENRNETAVALKSGQTGEISAVGTIAVPAEVDGDRAAFTMRVSEWIWSGGEPQAVGGERIYVSVKLQAEEEQAIARAWKRGSRIRITGTAKIPETARNYGGFDFREYLRRQRIHWTVSAKGASSVQIEQLVPGSLSGRLLGWNDSFRDKVGSKLDGLFPVEEAGYMKGLLIGIREDLDPERFREFSRLGLTHILAISGLHVAVYAWAVTMLLRRLRTTKEKNMRIVLWTIPLYVIFTGSSPSVIRAGLTAMAGLFASGRGWRGDGLSLLGAAAMAMLLWNPYYLLDVGFQLSYLVTAGLIIGVPHVSKLMPVRSKLLNGSISVALTAQLVSFPLSVYYFNQFALLSLPANILLVPVISFIVTPLGYGALLLGSVIPTGGKVLGAAASWLNKGTFWSVERLDQASWGRLIWPSPGLWWIAVYYLLLGSALALLRKRQDLVQLEKGGLHLVWDAPSVVKRYKRAAAVVMLAFASLMTYGYSPYRLTDSGAGLVAFLDVGQGDAAYIRTPEGKHLLIDGGGTVSFQKQGEEWRARKDPYEVGRKTVVPLLKKRGVHQLDYIVISHEDADHIGGLRAVLEEIPVGAILFNGTLKPGPVAEALFREAIRLGVPLLPVHAGMDIQVDGRTVFKVMNPEGEAGNKLFIAEDQNEQTLVGMLQMNGYRFLFMGDIGADGERAMLGKIGDEIRRPTDRIDVLKVGHHGSKNSSSAEWLAYWKPAVSVISAGVSNLYGHPHRDTLQRLKAVDSKIYRTDLQGEVQVYADTGPLRFRSKLGNPAEMVGNAVKNDD